MQISRLGLQGKVTKSLSMGLKDCSTRALVIVGSRTRVEVIKTQTQQVTNTHTLIDPNTHVVHCTHNHLVTASKRLAHTVKQSNHIWLGVSLPQP